MKRSNLIFAILSALIIGGCYVPSYLPTEGELDVNRFGSYIYIKLPRSNDVRGELITADSAGVVVMTDSKSQNGETIVKVPKSEIKYYTLQYAQPHQYGWTIPVSALATITHGFFLAITMPVNIIVTASVTSGAQSAFRYDEKSIRYEDLKMFARFPQGIPPKVDLTRIKGALNSPDK